MLILCHFIASELKKIPVFEDFILYYFIKYRDICKDRSKNVVRVDVLLNIESVYMQIEMDMVDLQVFQSVSAIVV